MGFRTYLWDRRRSWLLALGLLAVLLVVLLLFRLPVLAVGYGALLCGVIGVCSVFLGNRRLPLRRRWLLFGVPVLVCLLVIVLLYLL